jgi:glycosyltransferase involved in cell wall biosynthesis
MSRFARSRRVFFFEEPVFEDVKPQLRASVCAKTGVRVNTPVLPDGLTQQQITECQRALLAMMLDQHSITDYAAWYYTPMALELSSCLRPNLTVYDCMDELAAFAGAPAAMRNNEAALFRKADLVFTGGASLFESKRRQHPSVHLFPSSVDVAHFSIARSIKQDPDDQAHLPRPRLGYAGVIDERMDLDLLRQIALERPNWQLILLGPIVKIDPVSLPRADNIHYLGMKQYADLPAYFSGWDIGLLPFALNESTRFISPTKIPEYLAAGLPVVSAPIRDVVTPYGDLGLVQIANDAKEFIRAADLLLENPANVEFLAQVDQFLSQSSWDKTWSNMNGLMETKLALKRLQSRARTSLPHAARGSSKGASNV